uniref:HDC14183 n=1 Tax=Drosophila melanogaster TaxID=7227 RepID=Q6IJU9_DROME|nr:TPA_inf: HDC14183 [Drosophila melanogaster]
MYDDELTAQGGGMGCNDGNGGTARQDDQAIRTNSNSHFSEGFSRGGKAVRYGHGHGTPLELRDDDENSKQASKQAGKTKSRRAEAKLKARPDRMLCPTGRSGVRF